MADFSDIGRVAAIESLYEGTPYKPYSSEGVSGHAFETSGMAYIATRSRLFLEGIDFDLVYFPLKHLGYKCVVAVTGELYADFYHTGSLAVRLGISAKLDLSQIKELWQGIVVAAQEHGYSDVSLDLAPSYNGLAISIAATGSQAVSIDGKRPKVASKDLLCLSGSLGGAFFGQQILERGKKAFDAGETPEDMEKHKMMIASYLKPEIDAEIVSKLESEDSLPSCGYLVTRGLGDALKRLVRDTGLGAKVYADKIPFEGNSFELGKSLNIDPISAAMNGGEDYRLLYVIPITKVEAFRRDFQTFDIIGHMAQSDVGAVLVTPEGVEFPVKAQGW